ncbi:undecaprenyl diphosphate synthase family protein [Haloquadratum walsbyi]|uniref:Undecaprenyl pyrophosphate synthase n=1 Tax=Haloquadratum walsbyi J07HQW2 TaxID=1238425 RepID=U1PP79_9EURY|nr:undecaprenyl diphosphate synthase family protein [Haloquadratum walsbyi]ERG95547.1 MAG: undecaprenyl pyrophosphate synthase [Haloquadratum walsbyi J07HQW2]
MGLYDRYLSLRHRFHNAKPPAHVAVVITEQDLLEQGAYQTLSRFFNWAFEYSAARVTISVSVLDEAVVPTLAREFRDLTTPRSVVVRQPGDTEPADAPIQVNIGLGGKREFASAVRQVAEAVDDGSIDPDAVDADTIEKRLVFADEPDLVIKTGAERLSDFLIWQSVYSELYFTDVNWRDFRRRDYLRAVIDYQKRQRRFGQ